MFALFDGRTPETARRLFERAEEVDRKYLQLPHAMLADQVAADIPENMRFISHDEVSFHFPDFPEFSFTIMEVLKKPLFSVFGGERYAGFMLQRSDDGWFTSIQKPIAYPVGSRAKRLAEVFERQHGVRNLTKIMGRFRR